ncbi:MAG TPA: rhodanese-like domain-containing protein [Nitrospiraceae bacterium]|jgi:phage shock protein E|nr:rhodanese-like domain-containing protein [Nitrospiraceae bacterium]
MKRRAVWLSALFVSSLFILVSQAVFAHHSYLLTVQQLRAGLMKAPSVSQKGFVLIDVRSPEEHLSGQIPGTDLNIDFREIKARHREIGAKPGDHIVVYCQSGHRSNIAAETLADLGYTNVYNVSGSMNAWMEAGYPVAQVR